VKNSESTGRKTILVVDDEDYLRDFLDKLLQYEGYNVILAKNGKEAVEIYKANPDSIDLILMDVTMPLQDGISAHKELTVFDLGVKILLMSGYAQHSLEGLEHLHFIRKPMFPESLFSAIKQIFDNPETAPAFL
jgi:two-component system, cell cycle sensor histidine kinase and response regulator CckA